ncbi:RNA-binding protein 1 [Typha angustifolia]|uniref:RNA-binding protein 1 n=1 Tax=Typha angustifolia TaxID=59011 RepID=UPI003C2BACBC
MADGYWRYGEARQQAVAAAMGPPSAPLKRPRPDYADIPGGPEIPGYYPRDEERTAYRAVRDTEAIGASYDRYLRNGMSSFGAGESIRPVAGGMTSHPVDDRRMMGVGGMDSRTAGYGGGRPEPPLPPDASNTLFVEGLPANCTRREVSHIFRPFVGFREVRLVNKESRHPGGDPLVLCFVDFSTPAQAAVALDALQGYKFDEHDRESANLRLQFARFPGPRSSGGPRGRR